MARLPEALLSLGYPVQWACSATSVQQQLLTPAVVMAAESHMYLLESPDQMEIPSPWVGPCWRANHFLQQCPGLQMHCWNLKPSPNSPNGSLARGQHQFLQLLQQTNFNQRAHRFKRKIPAAVTPLQTLHRTHRSNTPKSTAVTPLKTIKQSSQ